MHVIFLHYLGCHSEQIKKRVGRMDGQIGAEQKQTCSVLHVLHLHHLSVDSASEHIEGPVHGLGPLAGLLSRNSA